MKKTMTTQSSSSKRKRNYLVAALLMILFMFYFFLFEKNFGTISAPSENCIVSGGVSKVYIHWFKPMNNTVATFCDATTSPKCVSPNSASDDIKCYCKTE